MQAVKILFCNSSSARGVNFVNSPQTHILVMDSNDIDITHVTIQAPQTSPNTDGIHIHSSGNVIISHCKIGTGNISFQCYCTCDIVHKHNSAFVSLKLLILESSAGDDCVSIGDHTSNIEISHITCGPGHGIRWFNIFTLMVHSLVFNSPLLLV